MDTKVIITIIIGSSIVLVALIAGASSFFIRKSKTKHGSDLLDCIVYTLWQIPFILWYPFQTVIELVHGIIYRFNSCVHDFFEIEKYKRNKEQKLIRKAVSTVLHSHSNLLNTYLNRRVAKTLTLLLQIISFITTYAGFTFFLGAVNPIAPLFMAITVQGGCYYLLNYTSSRKRTGAWKRNILLGLLILTSTVTSYIGIFDGVVRPVEKMENQYNNYSNVVKSIINNQIDTKYKTTINYNLINDSLNTIEKARDEVNQEIETLKQYAGGIDTEKRLQASWTDNDGNVHPYVTTEKDNEAGNQKLDLEAQINRLSLYGNKLSTFLNTYPNAKEILDACNRVIEEPQKINNNEDSDVKLWNSLKNALEECNNLYIELHPEGKNESANFYESMNMDKAIESAEKRKLLEGLLLSDFDVLISGKGVIASDNSKKTDENTEKNNSGISTDDQPEDTENDAQDSNEFIERVLGSLYEAINGLNKIVVSKDVTKAQEIRDIINNAVNQNNSELSPLLPDNNNDNSDGDLEKLKNAYKEAHIENPQIMPFTLPFVDENVRGETIFSFITAFLVDFFSLLIAFALVNKQKSILYFKKVGDLRANREEMLEDCLMYICLNGMQEDTQSKEMSRSEVQDFVVKKINTVMRGFMEKVHPIYLPDDLNSYGYITDNEVKNFQQDERCLFFTLNNTALIHPCYYSEIIKIINSDFDEYKPKSKEPQADEELIKNYNSIFKKGEINYLVSKNLHVWFCENFSELLQNSMLFKTRES